MTKARVLLATRDDAHPEELRLRSELRRLIEAEDEMVAVELEKRPGGAVTPEESWRLRVLRTVSASEVDVVVLSIDPEDGDPPGICSHLWQSNPDLVVVAVSEAEERAKLHCLEPTSERLPGASGLDILTAIRGALGGGGP